MLAMASSTGVAPPSSPNALEVVLQDTQQLEVMSYGSNASPTGGETKPAPMNPLLLASVCIGSWTALNYLFSREDSQKPPMMMPTQVFLDLLVGHTPGSSTRTRLTVPQASGDVEDGVDQSALPAVARLLQGLTAEGDTALHMVASHGDNTDFLNCCGTIDKRDHGLLFQINSKGDTPLHCAARAGRSKMVSYLIQVATRRNRLHGLLRKESRLKETALHDAVRIGNKDIVDRLLEADHELGNYPREGTSPLYLAILLENHIIARTLHDRSNGDLSYSGPNGQNALHAATSHCAVITKDILKWNNILTTQGDRNGSTPLHVASSLWQSNGFKQLLEANPTPIYQADNNGLFPIHVAASVGATHTVRIILENFPSSAGLRTAQGQTFLHVAIEKEKIPIVFFVC
ncbi:hypothetical protein ZWY2020_055023 [Hordeum vulgare]|nr:hypothetical protein ZWY2020_055023 [Hordeum vulgare]